VTIPALLGVTVPSGATAAKLPPATREKVTGKPLSADATSRKDGPVESTVPTGSMRMLCPSGITAASVRGKIAQQKKNKAKSAEQRAKETGGETLPDTEAKRSRLGDLILKKSNDLPGRNLSKLVSTALSIIKGK
jgi:hypothetical protein